MREKKKAERNAPPSPISSTVPLSRPFGEFRTAKPANG